jgi:hypothetical protein
MSTLRDQLIRLAHQHEGLRPHLLPLLRSAANPTGKAQMAIMDYMESHDEGGDLTDIARSPSLRGVHFAQIESAAEALAKKGLIGFNGVKLTKKASILKVALSQVAKIILEQMGGARKIAVMLGIGSGPGYYFYDLPGNKGVGFSWPNRQRSKGNNVEIMLMPDDTYKMTFFNVSGADKKQVKKLDGIYADSLVDAFQSQTGWYLTL